MSNTSANMTLAVYGNKGGGCAQGRPPKSGASDATLVVELIAFVSLYAVRRGYKRIRV